MTADLHRLRSYVDISVPISNAAAASTAAGPEDGNYGELMATYVEFGQLLEAWNRYELDIPDAEFEQRCQDHVARLIELGKVEEEIAAQRWAVWMAKNTTVDMSRWH